MMGVNRLAKRDDERAIDPTPRLRLYPSPAKGGKLADALEMRVLGMTGGHGDPPLRCEED